MTTETITIYIGRWNDHDYVFSLEKEKAKSLVNAHFAFGDPLEHEYAIGDCWAAGDQDIGWRIIERKITVPVIDVELRTSESEDTSHLIWQCPQCGRSYSDDCKADEELPALLSCGCKEATKYLLGRMVQYCPKRQS